MKNLLLIISLLLILGVYGTSNLAFAQTSILPKGAGCETYDQLPIDELKYTLESLDSDTAREQLLGCAIISGNIHMFMIPFYIVFFIEFLVNIAGIVAVLFIIIGGFYYATSGVSDKKDLGKSTIMNALIGLALVTMAWVIVNIVQILLTQ